MKYISDESLGNPSYTDEVPWLNEYLILFPEEGKEFLSRINTLSFSTKGILIVADDFKAFSFQGTRLNGFLTDALKHWSGNPKDTSIPGMFLVKSKSLKVATDETVTDCFISIESEKRVRILWGKPTDLKESMNPFLSKSQHKSKA